MTKPTKNKDTKASKPDAKKAADAEAACESGAAETESPKTGRKPKTAPIGASVDSIGAAARAAAKIREESDHHLDQMLAPSAKLERVGKAAGLITAGNGFDSIFNGSGRRPKAKATSAEESPAEPVMQTEASGGGGGGMEPPVSAIETGEPSMLPISNDSQVNETPGRLPATGPARAVAFFCECFQKASSGFRSLPNWFSVVVIVLLAFAGMAVGKHVVDSYDEAMTVMYEGPAKAYALEDEGQAENAKRIWAQVSARSGWLGWFDGQDAPYLQRTVLAHKAQDWQRVTEFGYKALERPITDRQAVAVQQMLLDATANLVRAYLPNQGDQPIRGGVPDHAPPVCDAKTNVWIAPLVLLAMALLCLWGKMRAGFTVLCLLIPAYFAGVSEFDNATRMRCEARLAFNPDNIVLVAGAPSRSDHDSLAKSSSSGHGVVTIEPAADESPKKSGSGNWMDAGPAVVQTGVVTGGSK